MNFKEFEEKISNINNQIFAFFLQIEDEENQKMNDVFQALKQNLEAKKAILFSHALNIEQDELRYQQKITDIKEEVTKISIEPLDFLYVLDEKAEEIKQKKLEEQNKITATIRRRRSEFAHRINTLNKDMVQALKEHNALLDEEEKNYQSREAELTRRMNIDLQKANDATVKAYSDLEKALLDTNDNSGIADLKKKILLIRSDGFREQETIKNKYEFSFIENTLEYKRYYEKILLENAVILDDFSVKIKTLEHQRNMLEMPDDLKISLTHIALDKQYVEWENEQNLFAIESKNKQFARQFTLKQQINIEKINYDNANRQKLGEYHQVAYETDGMQFDIYRPLETYISEDVRKQCNYLLESLSDCVETFQANLLGIVENTWAIKKRLRNDLSKHLLVSIKSELHIIEDSYVSELNEIEQSCKEYYKLQNNRFNHFLKAVASQTKKLLEEVKATIEVFQNYYQEEQKYRLEMDRKINVEMAKGNQNAISNLTSNYEKQVLAQKNYQEQLKEEEDRHKATVALETSKVNQWYEEKIKDLDLKTKQSELDHQKQMAMEEQNFQMYIKNSKLKLAKLKSEYSDNLIRHERNLDKKYRNMLVQNEKERKAKIKAL